MKKIFGFICVYSIIVIMSLYSCNNDPSNSNPTDKQKYAWACGTPDSTGYGLILFSSDGGDSWVRQGLGSTAMKGVEFTDIWAIDEKNVWAIGSSSIVRTVDGGNTWSAINLPISSSGLDLLSIFVQNKTNIWISGGNGTILNSADNGSSWRKIDATFFNQAFLQGIWLNNESTIFVVDGIEKIGELKGYIAQSKDGGENWIEVIPAENYNQHEWIGASSSGETVVIYGRNSHYIVSTNGGETWKNDSVPQTGGLGGADINHLNMLNEKTWWGAFDMGQIFKTTDAGLNWIEQQTEQGAFYMLGIDNWDSNLALAVGAAAGPSNNCPIVMTTNGGSTWNLKFKTSNSSLRKVTFIKD